MTKSSPFASDRIEQTFGQSLYRCAPELELLKPESPQTLRRRLAHTSEELSRTQCQNITEAAWFALDAGLPLNRYITINWTTAGVHEGYATTAQYLKRAGDWLAARQIPLAYCWVRENEGGDHVHILIHVPAEISADFSRLQRRWRRASVARNARAAVKTRPVGFSYAAAATARPHYCLNLDRVLRYILKGASSDAADFTNEQRR